MNQILLSFICGAAFIGGAVAMTVLVVLANSVRTKEDRDAIHDYWKQSLEKHGKQLQIMERIADAMTRTGDALEKQRKDNNGTRNV